MSRRHWNVIFAVVGLALAAALFVQSYQFYQAAEQHRASYQYNPARSPGFRIGVPSQRPTPHYKPSCNNPNDREDADLCAQWAAVDQVTEANRLSGLNLRLSILAFVATIIGTAALIWTLLETRTVARRELRAYLFVDGVAIGDGTHHPGRSTELMGILGSALGLKNSGTTPAHRVVHWSAVDIAYFDKEEELRAPVRLDCSFASSVPPGGTISADRAMSRKPTAKMIAAIKAGRAAAFVYGAIEYMDVFDAPHRTNYRLYFSGSWPPPKEASLRFSNSGNDAT